MALTIIFQISIYALAAFSGGMLAAAEGTALPTALTVPLAVAAFFFNERLRVLRLPLFIANLLGAVALLAAIWELMGENIEARLLSGAHMLVYLSWIVLFQEKSTRHYWWMCALGVLQVAVGAVLTNAGSYGVMLGLYLIAGIWTLSVFSLYQARTQFEPQLPNAAPAPPTETRRAKMPSLAAAASMPGQFSLRSSQVRNAIQLDPQERWVSVRFALGTLVTAFVAMMIGAVFFLFIPRVWIGPQLFARDLPADPGRILTGFTEQVQLGDIGQILESTEPVLDLRLIDEQTGRHLDVNSYTARLGYEEPLFRGAVLSRYDSGQWTAGNIGRRAEEVPARPDQASVRQEIRMQPIGTEILLAIHPVIACRLDETERLVAQDRRTQVLAVPRRVELPDVRRYQVWSPRSAVPAEQTVRNLSPKEQRRQRLSLEQYRQLPDDGLEQLAVEARRVTGYVSENEHPPDAEMAERLVYWLRDSGEFGYSLDASIQDRTVDVVEDFLLIRKQGHCEYFASALVLMLRSVDIPARLISGFKGGKVNRISGLFEIEQRHAHAWTEAYIDEQWVVLDATPADARTESVESMSSRLPAWIDFVSFVKELWSRYVVNMNFNQQRAEFYGPLTRWIKRQWQSVSDSRSRVVEWWNAFRDFLSSPRQWFSWQGGLFTFVLLLLVSGMVWTARWLWRRWSAWQERRDGRLGRRRRSVLFYERFQRICAGCGLVRSATQTPLEFADDVHGRLNSRLTSAGLAEFPRELVTFFYRLRYGELGIDDETERRIDRRLTELEQCVVTPSPSALPSRR